MSETNNPNDELIRTERALGKALYRKDAPAGFTDAVLERARDQSFEPHPHTRGSSWLSFFPKPLIRWTAATAACAAMILGMLRYHEVKVEREQTRGEAAKQQLVLALRIAGSKLQRARTKVIQTQANSPEHQQEKD